MPVYRYMDDEYAKDFAYRGRLRLLPLEHYATMEVMGSNDARGDQHEGRRTATLDKLHAKDVVGGADTDKLRRLGIAIGPGVRIENLVIERSRSNFVTPPSLVMCMSMARDLALALRFRARTAVEVLDLGRLIEAISAQLLPGFDFAGCAPVRYVESREADFRDDIHDLPPWAIKETPYEIEQEVRAIWRATAPDWAPRAKHVTLGDLSSICRLTRFW